MSIHEESRSIRVTPIEERFAESFHRCLDSVARERRYLALVQAPPVDATCEFVRNNIANAVPRFVAVTSNDEVVGWCDLTLPALDGFTHCGHLGMGVRHDYRGRGLGTALLRATMQAARDKGLERVELEVFASNLPAIELYRKQGFVTEGVKNKARKIDGKYDDVVLMALPSARFLEARTTLLKDEPPLASD
jgi:ribosomal protein S18 acetylase RimI-like enzyme